MGASWPRLDILPIRWFRSPYYHCISRVVERRLAFGPEEKEQFVRLMVSSSAIPSGRVRFEG